MVQAFFLRDAFFEKDFRLVFAESYLGSTTPAPSFSWIRRKYRPNLVSSGGASWIDWCDGATHGWFTVDAHLPTWKPGWFTVNAVSSFRSWILAPTRAPGGHRFEAIQAICRAFRYVQTKCADLHPLESDSCFRILDAWKQHIRGRHRATGRHRVRLRLGIRLVQVTAKCRRAAVCITRRWRRGPFFHRLCVPREFNRSSRHAADADVPSYLLVHELDPLREIDAERVTTSPD